MWELEGEGFQQDQEKGAPRTEIWLEDSTPTIQGQGEGARETLKEVVGSEAEGKGALLGVEGQSYPAIGRTVGVGLGQLDG